MGNVLRDVRVRSGGGGDAAAAGGAAGLRRHQPPPGLRPGSNGSGNGSGAFQEWRTMSCCTGKGGTAVGPLGLLCRGNEHVRVLHGPAVSSIIEHALN